MKKVILILSLLFFSVSQAQMTIVSLDKKARQGNADAQFKMGLINEFGITTKEETVYPDINQAEYWYKKADRNGKIRATTRLAVIYYDEGDFRKSIPYLKKAILAKEPLAMVYYGKYLLSKNNIKSAKKYFKEGINNNVPQAFYEYGVLLGDNEKDFYEAYINTSIAKIKGFKNIDNEKIEFYKSRLNPSSIYAANKVVLSNK